MKNSTFRLLAAPAAVILFALFSWALGIYVNTTESMTTGIWITERRGLPHSFARGDTVIIEKDQIPHLIQNTGHVRRFMKKVIALPGDIVDYDQKKERLTINGSPLPGTKIQDKDSAGRRIICHIRYPLIVPEGYLFLGSDHPRGYDSRYFGPVSMNAAGTRVRLLYSFSDR